MLQKTRDNALILQAYIEFKKKFNLEELTFMDVIQNGYRLLPDNDKNKDFFAKSRLKCIEIKNNFTEWHYYHNPPELECPNFKFILNSPDEEFATHFLDNDTKITYNVETNLQIISTKKLRVYNYQEIMEFLTEQITMQKNVAHAMFLAVQELAATQRNIKIIHLSYQKVILKLNDELTINFVITFSKSDLLRILITPPIGSLNDFLATKFQKIIYLDDIQIIKAQYKFLLFELIESYEAFKTIVEMQYYCDSLRQGPNMDNVSFFFELMQINYPLYYDQFVQHSLDSHQEPDQSKELVMIMNYRRLFQLGVKINKVNKSIILFDYAKQCYQFYECDLKPVFNIFHGEALSAAIQDINMGLITNEQIIFSQKYESLLNENSSFSYILPYSFKHQLVQVCQIAFDYVGCLYLMIKIKQMIHWYFSGKTIGQVTKLEAQLNILEMPRYQGMITTVIQNNTFSLQFKTIITDIPATAAIEIYFNKKLGRCFYNYKNIKGFIGILLTKLFAVQYIYEIMHFEIAICEGKFVSEHQQQEELNELMSKKKLNIELMLDGTDAENGKYFSIKFIDPQTRIFKIIRFIEQKESIYYPENQNQKLFDYESYQKNTKFLQRILFLMTLDLKDLN